MIVDSSALVAVAFAEPGYLRFVDALSRTEARIGAPTAVETGVVLAARLGPTGGLLASSLIERFAIELLPFDERHWAEAVVAFQRFGRGKHPAGLNFGDCLSYAVAKVAGDDLLYKGSDFAQTDIRSALTGT